jgi:hypothetical protein
MQMSDEIVAGVRAICMAFPEVREEGAWVGVRWRIRTRTFAHMLSIDDSWPSAYARAAATDGPAVVLMFRSSGAELDALRHGGHPFFGPPWRADEVGMLVEEPVDWSEVAELLIESYCAQAPKRLGESVRRPPAP